MKALFISLAICMASFSFAQTRVVMEDDTATYKGQKFYAGKEFRVAGGSGHDKTFQWIFVSDEKYSDVKPLYNVYANRSFMVEKIYNTHRGWSVQTRLPDIKKGEKVIRGELVFFAIDKAVDHREVAIE